MNRTIIGWWLQSKCSDCKHLITQTQLLKIIRTNKEWQCAICFAAILQFWIVGWHVPLVSTVLPLSNGHPGHAWSTKVDYRGEAGYSQDFTASEVPLATQADHSIALDNKVLSTQSSGIFSIFDSPFRRMSPEMSLAMLPAYYVRHYVRHGYSFPTIRKDANVSDVFSPFAKVRTRIVPVQPHNTFATAVSEYLLDCYHKTVWFFLILCPTSQVATTPVWCCLLLP